VVCNGIQVQPGCCECKGVVYNSSGPLGCLPLIGDADDPAALAASRIAFLGPANFSCSTSYSYPAPLQLAIKDWVTAGGRLFLTAEPYNCFTLGDPANATNFNNFLGFLGTGLQLTTNIPFGCPPIAGCFGVIPATIGVMNGIANPYDCTSAGEISGGTPLAYTSLDFPFLGCDVPNVMMAAEQIGSGLVVACGAPYEPSFCMTDGTCEFFNRLCKWSVSRILAV